MTTSVRGKLITIGPQQRFFAAVSRGPLGALDAAPERDDEDERSRELAFRLARDAEVDAREADLDAREEAEDEGKEGHECTDRKAARDKRAIARDRRARERRGQGARDALPDRADHRRDFRSNAEDAACRGMAADKRAKAANCPPLGEIFALDQHPHGNRSP